MKNNTKYFRQKTTINKTNKIYFKKNINNYQKQYPKMNKHSVYFKKNMVERLNFWNNYKKKAIKNFI